MHAFPVMPACPRPSPVRRLRTRLLAGLVAVLACDAGLAATYPELRECHDPKLQAALDEVVLARPEYRKLIEGKRAAVVVADVTDLEHPRVAGYNPDLMLYAASLPKIAIAFGAIVEIDGGRMTLDEETHRQMVSMIKKSSNRDATAVLEKVGIERLAEILQDPAHGALYDPKYGGGLWVGKPYGKGAAWKRDPLHGLSHGATPMSAARFYYGVLTGTLVDHKHLPLLREMFGEPGIQHKFVKGLEGRDVDIYRKSGTWQDHHADSALVVRPESRTRYIAVAIGQGPNKGKGFVDFIRLVDGVMESQEPSPDATCGSR